ncbi:MAG TPA: hypothetical protein PLU02_10770 [Chitinophagales bacterium]|nr:hypothetical protein [Chitinophagales bacterium]
MTFEEALNKKQSLGTSYQKQDVDGSYKEYTTFIAPRDEKDFNLFKIDYFNLRWNKQIIPKDDLATQYCSDGVYIVLGFARINGVLVYDIIR